MEKEKLALLAEIINLLKARLPEQADPLKEKAISDDLIKREAARLILGGKPQDLQPPHRRPPAETGLPAGHPQDVLQKGGL